ncbi:hypothetical protein, partial [Glycomyces tenuis]
MGIFAEGLTGAPLRILQVFAVLLAAAALCILLIPRWPSRKLLAGLLAVVAALTVAVGVGLTQIRE